MGTWLKDIFAGPATVIFIGIIITTIAEILRDRSSKKIWLTSLIFGVLITGLGGIWAARQQSNFEQSILGSITGGDSYCYVLPLVDESSGRGTFMLAHQGKYPLYDISVILCDETKIKTFRFEKLVSLEDMTEEKWESLNQERDLYTEFMNLKEKATDRYEIGTLPSGTSHNLTYIHIPKELPEQEFHVQIFTRNGVFYQTILYRRVHGLWRHSMKITKDRTVLYEQIHPEILLTDKE